jgi:hypothetical protein
MELITMYGFKCCLDLIIKNVAEILLPQILQEDTSTRGGSNSSVSSTVPSVSVDMLSAVPAKVTTNQSIDHAAVENNRLKVVAKEEVAAADHNNPSDAFAFVTEMKIQMSQPHSPTPTNIENSCVNSSKRIGERGRGTGRARRSQRSKAPDILDNSPNFRHSSQSQALGTATSTSVQGAVQNMNNVNTKPRSYAQAIKRTGVAGDGVVIRSQAVSQGSSSKVTSANGSPSNSDCQKY